MELKEYKILLAFTATTDESIERLKALYHICGAQRKHTMTKLPFFENLDLGELPPPMILKVSGLTVSIPPAGDDGVPSCKPNASFTMDVTAYGKSYLKDWAAVMEHSYPDIILSCIITAREGEKESTASAEVYPTWSSEVDL